MSRMVSVRTEELTGPALAWAIESIEGAPPAARRRRPAATATRSGHRRATGVWCERGHRYPWLADLTNDPCNRQPGETRTIAVFRAVVFAKHGKTVSVPAELIQL